MGGEVFDVLPCDFGCGFPTAVSFCRAAGFFPISVVFDFRRGGVETRPGFLRQRMQMERDCLQTRSQTSLRAPRDLVYHLEAFDQAAGRFRNQSVGQGTALSN